MKKVKSIPHVLVSTLAALLDVRFLRRLVCIFACMVIGGNMSALIAQDEIGEQQRSKQLSEILHKQAAAWNRGDISAFMMTYWKSEKLTFSSGGKTERGWEATKARYMKRYPDRATMGKLAFKNLETQELGSDAALMLGTWHLDRAEPISGNFSLVWKHIDSRWVIIHDHTSSNP